MKNCTKRQFETIQTIGVIHKGCLYNKSMNNQCVDTMFSFKFEGILIEIRSLLRYIFLPEWRRSYRIAKYMHHRLTAQEAMILAGALRA